MNFADEFARSDQLLNERRTEEAIEGYFEALALAENNQQRQQAWQMVGKTYRLDRQFDKAYFAFDMSSKLAQSVTTRARIQRDRAMTLLDQAMSMARDDELLNEAEDELIKSIDTLARDGDNVEAAVSRGILARVYFMGGKRALARDAFMGTDAVLSDTKDPRYNIQYELNNLIWFARESFVFRYANAPRALRLTNTLGQPHRRNEYLKILFGRDNLYRNMSA